MKTIVIPTDFNLKSLTCIETLCKQEPETQFRLIFIHLFKMSDSITELLLLSRRNKEYDYVGEDFYAACEALRLRFPQVADIKVDFFYGSTLSMFRNYLEAHGITAVLDLKACSLKPLNRMSVNPESLFQRCGLDVIALQPVKETSKIYKQEMLLEEAV